MKSIIYLVLAVRLFAPFVSLCEAGDPSIAALLPLSGNNSRHGDFARKGIELALSDVGASHPVVFEDTQMQPRLAIDAYQRLASHRDVVAVLALGSGVSMALSPLANRDRNLLLAIVAAPDFSSAGDYTFRIVGSAAQEAYFIADILQRRLKTKRLAIICEDSDYGHGVSDALERTLQDRVSVVVRESFLPGSSDMRSLILKVRRSSPDLIFIGAPGLETGLIIRQAHESGYKARYLCPQACENPDLISAAGDSAEGLFVSAPSADASAELEQAYLRRYGERPSFASLRMYDATRILLGLIGKCRKDTDRRACTLKGMQELRDFPGASFPVNFDEYGDLRDVFVLKTVKAGKFQTVRPQDALSFPQ